MWKSPHLCVNVGSAVLIVVASASSADIINVPADQPTIQAGIDAAMNGDEVVVAPGTYIELIDFIGKAITVRSTDPTDPAVVANTIIDARGSGSVVTCNSGEGPDTVLDGFTVTGGTGTDPGDGFVRGGGMFNIDSSPTVTNCTFEGNTADLNGWGAGMANSGGSPTVTNCTFSGNSANRGGGDVQRGQQFDGDELHLQRELGRRRHRRGDVQRGRSQPDGGQLHVRGK